MAFCERLALHIRRKYLFRVHKFENLTMISKVWNDTLQYIEHLQKTI